MAFVVLVVVKEVATTGMGVLGVGCRGGCRDITVLGFCACTFL